MFSDKEQEFLRTLQARAKAGSRKAMLSGKDEGKRKVIRAVSHCKLCKTETTQFFVMVHRAGTWEREGEVKESELDPLLSIEGLNTKVNACWNCKELLLQKSKDELAKMIIDFVAPPVIKPYIPERKVENVRKGIRRKSVRDTSE